MPLNAIERFFWDTLYVLQSKTFCCIFWELKLRITLEDWVWGHGWKVILSFLTTLINGPEQDSYDRKYYKERIIFKKEQCFNVWMVWNILSHFIYFYGRFKSIVVEQNINIFSEQDKICNINKKYVFILFKSRIFWSPKILLKLSKLIKISKMLCFSKRKC